MTAKEIAKAIGVSEATVSLVVNGKPGISDKTRKMVVEKINDLGYGYLLHKQTKEDKGRSLGFVLFKNRGELLGMNSFFPLILEGIEARARDDGYSLTVLNVERQSIREQAAHIREANCAGFVIFATELQPEDLDEFEALDLPFVVLDNELLGRKQSYVKVNNMQGTYLAVRHLYEHGHRKIGYLSSGLQISSFLERQRCAVVAGEMFGLPDMRQYIYPIGYPNEIAEVGMEELLSKVKRGDLPTAFLADNDLVAAGAMLALRAKGYRIPEDFSLVGYDDRPICTMMQPKLTTVQLPPDAFGRIAVGHLISMLRNDWVEDIVVEVNCRLIERETVGPPQE